MLGRLHVIPPLFSKVETEFGTAQDSARDLAEHFGVWLKRGVKKNLLCVFHSTPLSPPEGRPFLYCWKGDIPPLWHGPPAEENRLGWCLHPLVAPQELPDLREPSFLKLNPPGQGRHPSSQTALGLWLAAAAAGPGGSEVSPQLLVSRPGRGLVSASGAELCPLAVRWGRLSRLAACRSLSFAPFWRRPKL